MTVPSLVGHQDVLEKFSRWLSRGRLASTYLLAGQPGIGKRRVAMHLARALLCEGTPADELRACGQCPACHQVDAETHPDLLVVERPPDKNLIPVELLIGARDQRMRAGLCHDIALKPFRGGRRIAIIDDADFLNQEGANCLLKTLEEPPPASLVFLISASEHRQLPTIRSRCQIVRFQPLSPAEVKTVLQRNEIPVDEALMDELALASAGSLQLAQQLVERETFEFRQAWFGQLAGMDPGADDFADSIGSFVEAAGKDNAARRDRLRLVAELAAWFYRQVMVRLCGQEVVADQGAMASIRQAVARWPADAEAAADCIERCGAVTGHVAANANQTLVIESFLSDLGKIVRGEVFASHVG